MSDFEHDTLRIWTKGEDYNKMFKFGSINELVTRVKENDNVPPVDSFIVEARRDDNIIALNEQWAEVLDKILLIFGYDDIKIH